MAETTKSLTNIEVNKAKPKIKERPWVNASGKK